MSTILITGCSSGFGLLPAVQFAEAGDAVYAGVRGAGTAGQLRAVADEHEQLNIVDIDVVDPASVEACVEEVIAASGRIDVLVNNAAVARSPPSRTDDDQARRLMETNFMGPLRVTPGVLPRMRAQGGARVILVSSVGRIRRLAVHGVYVSEQVRDRSDGGGAGDGGRSDGHHRFDRGTWLVEPPSTPRLRSPNPRSPSRRR